jgi:hypothetical protein
LAIAFDDGRIALPTPAPVLGVPAPPFARAVLANLPVFRVRGYFAVSAIGAPASLALHFTAYRLTRLKLGWLKEPLTIATLPFEHTGVVPLSWVRRRI